jgi:hypothetical protein
VTNIKKNRFIARPKPNAYPPSVKGAPISGTLANACQISIPFVKITTIPASSVRVIGFMPLYAPITITIIAAIIPRIPIVVINPPRIILTNI